MNKDHTDSRNQFEDLNRRTTAPEGAGTSSAGDNTPRTNLKQEPASDTDQLPDSANAETNLTPSTERYHHRHRGSA